MDRSKRPDMRSKENGGKKEDRERRKDGRKAIRKTLKKWKKEEEI